MLLFKLKIAYENIIKKEDIIRRCCICKKTETLPQHAEPQFSDGILSIDCFTSFYKGQIPQSEMNEIMASSNGSKIYQSCKELPGPFYHSDESNSIS